MFKQKIECSYGEIRGNIKTVTTKTRICFETFLSSFDSCNTFKLVN